MHTLYSAAECQQLDKIAIEQYGIPGIRLMKRAGTAAFNLLRQRWPDAKALTIYCGGGNNGGDGYIVAALAAAQHMPVQVIALADPKKLTGDAALARDFATQAGVVFEPFSKQLPHEDGVIVDALLGTGTQGAPRGDYANAIEIINKNGLPVLAIDIPSGLQADTGATPGLVVNAEATITFIGRKCGLYTAKGPTYCGEVVFDSLGVPAEVYAELTNKNFVIKRQQLPPRNVDAHKGSSGHVLVVGGDHGMGGAVLMAAEAAARCGAGLVSVATREEHVSPILTRRPEIMAKAAKSLDDFLPLLAKATVVVIGPGLGRSEWSHTLLEAVLNSPLPKVIDADGLNLLASEEKYQQVSADNWVLTPHPGEASRLLSNSISDIQANRFDAVTRLQQKRGGAIVLKGVGSLVASTEAIGLCTAGNPGMGSGGMGDVLSGVIGALLAQGCDVKTAAEQGVLLHAMAGDKAAGRGQRGLLATDLLPHLRNLVNGL